MVWVWETICLGHFFHPHFCQLPAAAGAGCGAKSTCSSGPRGCGGMCGVMGRSFGAPWVLVNASKKIRFYRSMFSCFFVVMFFFFQIGFIC